MERAGTTTIFTWEVGDKEATERAFVEAEVTVKEKIVYQRVHPCPLETCACVASMDKIQRRAHRPGTFQAPHVVRTVASLLSGIPEVKIHIIAPDIGGGFGNKVGSIRATSRDRRLHRARRPGEVGRGPDRKSFGHGIRP